MKKPLVILIMLFSIIFIACSPSERDIQTTTLLEEKPKTGLINRSIDHDSLEREYILYVPKSYTGDEPVPLLFSFHGYTATAEQLMETADFLPTADRTELILVYPQGSILEGKTHWNVGGWTSRSAIDDVGFTEAMIDELSLEYNIDLSRVYALGHSNGGYMCFRLACELSEKIAAVVILSGSMTPEIYSSCDPQRPIPIMQIHGTADETVPYYGAYWSLSIDEMLNYWDTKNMCDQKPITTALPHNPNTTSGTSIEQIQYSGCDHGVTIAHYKVIGGGHEWPGTMNELGLSNVDLNTNDEIWGFLSRYNIDGIIE